MKFVHPSPGAQSSGGEKPVDPTDPEAITRVLLEKGPLLVYVVDLEYRVVLFNRALREATGYDTADCPDVSALLRRFYPDERYRSVVHAIHDGWRKNEHIRGAELVVHGKDGSQRTVSWSTSRLKIARGAASGYIAMGVDVTTRRSLEQWVSLLQRSLQHLDEGVVLTDPLGRVLAWNSGATWLLGHDEGRVQGRFFSELFLRQEREIIARTVDRSVESQGSYEGEVELEKADGKTAILRLRQHRLDGEGGVPIARLTILTDPSAEGGAASPDPGVGEELARLQSLVRAHESGLEERDQRIAARERAIEELRALAEEMNQNAAQQLQAALAESERRALHAEAQVMDLEGALARGQEALTQAQQERDAAQAGPGADRVPELEARVGELGLQLVEAESTLELRAAELRAAGQELLALRERVELERSALTAALEGARIDAESALDTLRRDASADRENALTNLRQEMLQLVRHTELRLEEERERGDGLERRLGDAEEARAASVAKAQDDVRAALEHAIDERSQLEAAHRGEMAAAAERAAAERRSLEEQLHRDILAAEERAELERTRLEGKLEQQRAEWQDSASIARAEAESKFRAELDVLRAQIGRTPPLESLLLPVGEPVLVTDTEGRIVAWSSGAARLVGGAGVRAGQILHRDVLALPALPWKTLFARVVVAGIFEQETEVDCGGTVRRLRVSVTLLRNPQGRPVGITERLTEPSFEVPEDTHAAAALGRLLRPGLDALALQVDGAAALVSRSGAQLRDLLEIARLVDRGAPASDLEPAIRRVDLRVLHRAAEAEFAALEQQVRSSRAALRDLSLLAGWVVPDGAPRRWNEIVERAAAAVESGGGTRFFRRYGEAGNFTGGGDRVLGVLLQLLSAPAVSAEPPSLLTMEGDGYLTLEISGLGPPVAAGLVRHLAEGFGGEVSWTRGAGPVRLRVPSMLAPRPVAPGGDQEDAPGTAESPAAPGSDALGGAAPALQEPGHALRMGGIREGDAPDAAEESGVGVIRSGVVRVVVDEDREIVAMAGEDSWAGPMGVSFSDAGGGEPGRALVAEPAPPRTESESANRVTDPADPSPRPSATVITIETPILPSVPSVPAIPSAGAPAGLLASNPSLVPLPPLEGGPPPAPRVVVEDGDDLELMDELDEVFAAAPEVSPSLLETAREMEDFAAGTWDELDDLVDVEGEEAPDAAEGGEAEAVDAGSRAAQEEAPTGPRPGGVASGQREPWAVAGGSHPAADAEVGLDDDATRPYQVPAELARTDSDGAMNRAMATRPHGKKKRR